MAVEALVDAPVRALLAALDAVRSVPAPVGGEADRLASLAHASAELRGVFLRDLAAVDPGTLARAGARNGADLLVQGAGVPVWQARRDWAVAGRLAAVPGLPDVVAGGGLGLDAALQLVRAWRALPFRLQDQALAEALIALAQLVDLRDLRGKVDELLGALAPEVTDADLADAREQAELTLQDVGARTRWSGETDALTGELVRQVLRARAEADRADDDPRPAPRRAMDALVAILQAAATTDAVPGDPTLVIVATVEDLARSGDVHADRVGPDDALEDLFEGTDLLGAASSGPDRAPDRPRWTACTRGGLRLGPRTLAALTCTSRISRLVLGPLGHPLDSTPEARQLNRPQRRALEHRAGYRCEHTGCGRTAGVCVPHHVVPWALGGPTVLSNTVLLCVSCHHLLHDRDRPLALTGGRRIGPRGWLRPDPPDGLLGPAP